MEDLTVSIIQARAQKYFNEGVSWSHIIMGMQRGFDTIRTAVIELIENDECSGTDIEAIIQRISIERVQRKASELMSQRKQQEALNELPRGKPTRYLHSFLLEQR